MDELLPLLTLRHAGANFLHLRHDSPSAFSGVVAQRAELHRARNIFTGLRAWPKTCCDFDFATFAFGGHFRSVTGVGQNLRRGWLGQPLQRYAVVPGHPCRWIRP